MKIERYKVPFAQVANAVLNDQKLSWKAKGIYAYLFSKPETWDFSTHRIKDDSTDGRESLLTGIKELEDAGYLKRERQGNGRVKYVIAYAEPQSGNSTKEIEPESGNPTVGKPHSGKTRPVSNIDNTSNTEKESNTYLQNTPGEFARKFFEGDLEAVGQIEKQLEDAGLPKTFIVNELLKFKNYWTEPTRSGKKQRWETEKTFEVRRRLGTWFRNAAERSNGTRRSGAGVRV